MEIFTVVFFKTISILLSVIIGFLAGKYSKVEQQSVASLLFYFISPIVFFAVPAATTLNYLSLSISILIFFTAIGLSISAYYFFSKYWQDKTPNIIALSAGTANGSYFMLPIASLLFDNYTLSIYMMAVIGINVFEATFGFYISNKTDSSLKESLMKVIKLPILNAFVLGCLFSILGFNMPDFLNDFIHNMKGAFSILGMVMVGIALSSMKKFEIDIKFTLATFLCKFVLYPLIITVIIFIDKILFKYYDKNIYNALKLVSIAPLASNLIVISSLQNFYPEKVATTVFLSCIFATLYIPLFVSLFIT